MYVYIYRYKMKSQLSVFAQTLGKGKKNYCKKRNGNVGTNYFWDKTNGNVFGEQL